MWLYLLQGPTVVHQTYECNRKLVSIKKSIKWAGLISEEGKTSVSQLHIEHQDMLWEFVFFLRAVAELKTYMKVHKLRKTHIRIKYVSPDEIQDPWWPYKKKGIQHKAMCLLHNPTSISCVMSAGLTEFLIGPVCCKTSFLYVSFYYHHHSSYQSLLQQLACYFKFMSNFKQ